MKNLKIGVKILLGFGIVIALLIVSTVAATVSSLTTMQNLRSIKADSTLQTLANDLLDTFYNARLNVRILFIQPDDTAYNDAVAELTQCDGIISDMNGIIDENPVLEKFRPQLNAVSTQLTAFRREVDDVQESNSSLAAIQADVYALGERLTALDNALDHSNIEAVSRDVSKLDDLLNGATLSSGIWTIRKQTDEMFMAGNAYTDHDALFLTIDDANALLDNFSVASTEVTELRSLLPEYRGSVKTFQEGMLQNDELIDAAMTSGGAMLASINDMTDSVNDAMTRQVVTTTSTATVFLIAVIAVAIVSIAVSIFMALFISRSITKPVDRMRDYLVQVGSTGNIVLSPKAQEVVAKDAEAKDEVGQCAQAMLDFITHLQDAGEDLNRVADGDLAFDVKLLSENDTMGLAISRMIESLNNMFDRINHSTRQVSAGANQMADGAQSLAQGSTEQAATVQELSSSVSEVAVTTKENADMASRAAQLAESIKHRAEKGSLQMDQMIEAVKEISEASQNINKVIKVIDDIAFQTNILALNAAVEAARAGQHGKGFAVVAEEVRNLAAKSADAAKDTEALIMNSMEKADLGAHIAGETSESLAEIVSGIDESSQIVGDIARSSGEQAVSISQINEAIDQVAQVVQQNSATAEQSAAASEEMSGQSVMLRELVDKFKLKDSSHTATSPASAQKTDRDPMPAPDDYRSLQLASGPDKY